MIQKTKVSRVFNERTCYMYCMKVHLIWETGLSFSQISLKGEELRCEHFPFYHLQMFKQAIQCGAINSR